MRARWEEVEAAAAPVLADLERARPGCVRLEQFAEDDGPEALLRDTQDGSGTGIYLGDSHKQAWEAVLHMTAEMQDVAFEVFWRPWPECPQHPNSHPLEPDESQGLVVWTCPASGDVVAPVGELPA
jgi:hypothetical protein